MKVLPDIEACKECTRILRPRTIAQPTASFGDLLYMPGTCAPDVSNVWSTSVCCWLSGKSARRCTQVLHESANRSKRHHRLISIPAGCNMHKGDTKATSCIVYWILGHRVCVCNSSWLRASCPLLTAQRGIADGGCSSVNRVGPLTSYRSVLRRL